MEAPLKRWRRAGVEVVVLSERGGVSTGLLIRVAGRALLVDCGDGIARDLADRRLPAEELAGVVVTHDHDDHAAGLLALLWCLRLGRRSTALSILGPRRATVVDGLIALHRRVFRGRRRFAVRRRILAHGRAVRVGPFTIISFPVRHRRSMSDPPGQLMEVHGLTILVHGLRIVVSSDSGPCPELERAVAGADLALIEAGHQATMRRPPPDTHLTPSQAHAVGRLAKHHLLYHRLQRGV